MPDIREILVEKETYSPRRILSGFFPRYRGKSVVNEFVVGVGDVWTEFGRAIERYTFRAGKIFEYGLDVVLH